MADDTAVAAALSPTDGRPDCTTHGASILAAERDPHSDTDATPVATAKPTADDAADAATNAAAYRSPYSNPQRSSVAVGKT